MAQLIGGLSRHWGGFPIVLGLVVVDKCLDLELSYMHVSERILEFESGFVLCSIQLTMNHFVELPVWVFSLGLL